jgi:ketosteroid isomerase-like protein
VIDSWAQAMRVKDAAGVVAHQSQDFVQFDLAPPLRVVGADPKGLQDWFATWRGQIGYEIKDLHVAVGDDVGSPRANPSTGTTDGSSECLFRNTPCRAPATRGRSSMATSPS